MNEYMFLIRNAKDAKASLNAEEHLAFIQKCEVYIDMLKSQNILIAAQPLVREGVILSKSQAEWNQRELSLYDEIQVGYYHIRAEDMQEAIRIAENNPEFEYVASATIEVRPVKVKEEETQFVYPTNP